MKYLNPMYILLFSFILFLSSILIEKKSNIELEDSKYSFSLFKELSVDYSSLKNSWNNKKRVKSLVDKIISTSGLKNVKKEFKSDKILVIADNQSLNSIDKFVNKILNENLNIKKLNITKDSVEMEIKY